MSFPWDQKVITGLQNTMDCSEWWSSYGMALGARLFTRIFQPASSEHHVEDQIHLSFLCQVHENVTKLLSKLQVSRGRPQASRLSDGTQEVPSRLFCPLWDTCQSSAPAWVPVWPTRKHLSVLSLCWRMQCRTSRRDCWSVPWNGRSSPGHTWDLPWISASWPIMLFWWGTAGPRGRIWRTLLSGKELGLEEGKNISHGLLPPRFSCITQGNGFTSLWPNFSWYTHDFTKPLSAPVMSEQPQRVEN